MFEIFNFSQMSPQELIFSISFLAVVLVAVGYGSDVIATSHAYGPAGNGLILTFGAALGISSLYLFYRYFDTTFAFNIYKAHMFDAYIAKTGVAAVAGALSFFLFMVYVKRTTAD